MKESLEFVGNMFEDLELRNENFNMFWLYLLILHLLSSILQTKHGDRGNDIKNQKIAPPKCYAWHEWDMKYTHTYIKKIT